MWVGLVNVDGAISDVACVTHTHHTHHTHRHIYMLACIPRVHTHAHEGGGVPRDVHGPLQRVLVTDAREALHLQIEPA